MFDRFYKSKNGAFYVNLKSTYQAIIVILNEPYIIEIQNDKDKICDFAAAMSFHPDRFTEITHAQFYSVLFEAIEHLKEFLPDKNKDIFEVNGNADFTQDHDYDDENPDKEWWSHYRVV